MTTNEFHGRPTIEEFRDRLKFLAERDERDTDRAVYVDDTAGLWFEEGCPMDGQVVDLVDQLSLSLSDAMCLLGSYRRLVNALLLGDVSEWVPNHYGEVEQ